MIFVTQSFWMTRKILGTFAIFGKFADFSRPFLAVSLYKSRILLNSLFLLFLRYLQEAVSQNFLVNLILAIFAIFARSCLTKFSCESFFFLRKKNWLANFCDYVQSWTYLLTWPLLVCLVCRKQH